MSEIEQDAHLRLMNFLDLPVYLLHDKMVVKGRITSAEETVRVTAKSLSYATKYRVRFKFEGATYDTEIPSTEAFFSLEKINESLFKLFKNKDENYPPTTDGN